MSTGNVNRPTKNERRQQAREQAKLAHEAQQKKQKRNRIFLQGGIALGIVAVATIVTLIIVQNTKPEGPGPLNMATEGATFEEGLAVAATPALAAGETPQVPTVNRDALPLDIVIYVDYSCSHCGEFEQTNQELLNDLVTSGKATVAVHPLAFLSEYSTRAANAFGCVVNSAPESAWNLHSALLSKEVQPLDNPAGLTNEELLNQVQLSGASLTPALKGCVEDGTFEKFFAAATDRALTGPIPNLAEGTQLEAVQGTPTVLVNGKLYTPPSGAGSLGFADPNAFAEFVFKILGDVQSTEPAQ